MKAKKRQDSKKKDMITNIKSSRKVKEDLNELQVTGFGQEKVTVDLDESSLGRSQIEGDPGWG